MPRVTRSSIRVKPRRRDMTGSGSGWCGCGVAMNFEDDFAQAVVVEEDVDLRREESWLKPFDVTFQYFVGARRNGKRYGPLRTEATALPSTRHESDDSYRMA